MHYPATAPSRPRDNTASLRSNGGAGGFPLSDRCSPEREKADERRGKKQSSRPSLSHSTHFSHASTSPPSPRHKRASSFGTAAAPRHLFRRLLRARRLIILVPLFIVIVILLPLLSHLDSFEFKSSLFWRPEPQCTFMSTADALARDLARLREELGDITPEYMRMARSKGHTFSDTGHLLLSDDPNAPHPIPTLITLGEERWASLLAARSRTLAEAVDEYRRRYGRAPPRGFDKWWGFAQAHNVLLPDEYDGIHRDLAPFWALPKSELRRRLKAVEAMDEVFILEVQNGTVFVDIAGGGQKWSGTEGRAMQTAEMLASIAEHLPDVRATFSIFDQPQIYLSWARRDSLISLGLQGKHTTHLEEVDDGHVRLTRSCAPDSAFRTTPNATSGRSLVFDHTTASDICANPYLAPLHGLTIEPHEPDSQPRPHTQLLPLFSLAKTSLNSDILITPLEQFARPEKDWSWDDKSDQRLYWRGSPTGISMMHKGVPWRHSHRWRLHRFANSAMGERDVLVPRARNGSSFGWATERLDAAAVSKWFFNMQLAGKPIQCDEDDGTCDEMEEEITWAKFDPPKAARASKFLLDIDGNGWSGRFRRLMATNAVVIKTGIFTEWFTSHLVPWFHYVPSKLDFSDLDTIMAFFTGMPGQRLGFDETARALGHNGKCFVERMFRYADMQAYMLRLFLEYARVMAPEGVDMDFDLSHHALSL